MRRASQTSEQRTDFDDNFNVSTVRDSLRCQEDEQIFDHLETSVRQLLKRNSKFLKLSKLESQNKEQEMKTERLEVQSRHDNLRFMGKMTKVMNLGKNRRPECEIK